MGLARSASALLAALATLIACAAAQAHDAAPRAPGESLWPGPARTTGERQLREQETALLGTDHAAEHARLRACARASRRAAGSTATAAGPRPASSTSARRTASPPSARTP
jgi:hypothetical protein